MSPPARSGDGTVVGEVRASIDAGRLVPYLEKTVAGFQGPLTIKQFGFGQSNPTYFLQTPSRNYVLRRAPVGKLLSSTAHRVDREYMILERINAWNDRLPASKASRKVPVPKVYCLCMDTSVADAPFYVMEYLKGRIFTDILMPDLSREERAANWKAAVHALTLLATVPAGQFQLPATFAPDPTKKPYFSRQVRSMGKISDSQGAAPVKDYPGGVLGPITGGDKLWPFYAAGADKVDAADLLHGASVVHGDYKLDNMVFHPTEARVIGILDWELCTVGSPLADLGNMTSPFNYGPLSKADADALAKAGTPLRTGLGGLPSSQTGIPTRDDLEAWWVAGMNEGYLAHADTLRPYERAPEPWSLPIPNMPFVRSWMLFRLAIIMQGIAARAALGQASSASAVVTRAGMDFYGVRAREAKEEGEQRSSARL